MFQEHFRGFSVDFQRISKTFQTVLWVLRIQRTQVEFHRNFVEILRYVRIFCEPSGAFNGALGVFQGYFRRFEDHFRGVEALEQHSAFRDISEGSTKFQRSF